MNDMIIITKR